MVSIFSLFSGKKRRKSVSRPTSPTRNASISGITRPTSPTRRGSANRFLSLRSRSSSKPYDIPRRNSHDVGRARQNGAGKAGNEGIPKLTLGWEARAVDTRARDDSFRLGLDAVGRPPKLTEQETTVVRSQRWSVEEVMQAWKWFGKALRDSNLEKPGLMLPLQPDANPASQTLLLALFTKAVQPQISTSFPSLTNQYQSAAPSSAPDDNQTKIWADRLILTLQDNPKVADLAEVLKFSLRHLTPIPSISLSEASTTPNTSPYLDLKSYKDFVKAEIAATYPQDAYRTLFLSRLPLGIGAFLEEIFETFASIASRGDMNGMSGARLPLLLGWWICGMGTSVTSNLSWQQLYDQWQDAGRRTEHLFYAWIRNQALTQKLPMRLLQLVENYPFGTATESKEHLPLTQPSSFPRTALHVKLKTTGRLDAHGSPPAVLRNAFQADDQVLANLPLLSTIKSQVPDGSNLWQSALEETFAESSRAFLRQFPLTSEIQTEKPKALTNDVKREPPATMDVGPLYRPFSVTSQDPSASKMVRRRSQSLSASEAVKPDGKALAPLDALEEEVRSLRAGHSPVLRQRPSNRSEPEVASNGAWDSFAKSGFHESLATNLQLSPTLPSDNLDDHPPPPVLSNAVRSMDRRSSNRQNVTGGSKPSISIVGEEVIEIDDLFMSFAEDAQLDSSLKNFPQFALLSLEKPITQTEGSKPVEWLLITQESELPITQKSSSVVDPRSASPGALSTTSKFGSSFGLFRRTSSSLSIRNATRRSLFGNSYKGTAKQAASSTGLTPLPESSSLGPPLPIGKDGLPKPPDSAISSAPTEYTITDFGEMVKVPQRIDDERPLDVCKDTQSTEWEYRAEGGMHIVFRYTGNSDVYRNRVLRVRKGAKGTKVAEDLQDQWITKLLPELLPSELLASQKSVALDATWCKDLVASARGNLRNDVDSTDETELRAWLMQDLTASQETGSSILSVEIKPKRGNLPDAKYIQPSEAIPIKSKVSRYQLHEHLKDPNDPSNGLYNPLDLYSSDTGRLAAASRALWTVWDLSDGQRNNFRLYLDGRIISPDNVSSLPTTKAGLPAKESTLQLITESIQSSSVLRQLERLQAFFDPTDISDIAAKYRSAHPQVELFDAANSGEATSAELVGLVDQFKAWPNTIAAHQSWPLRQSMIAYSLSAIFKDCSIIIRIPLSRSTESWQVSGKPLVKVIDVDLKPMSSLRKWADLDEKIWRSWHESPPQGLNKDSNTTPLDNLAETLRARPKAVSNMSLSNFDAASTRAMFVPTPEASLPPTPMRPQVETLRDVHDSPETEEQVMTSTSVNPQVEKSEDPEMAPKAFEPPLTPLTTIIPLDIPVSSDQKEKVVPVLMPSSGPDAPSVTSETVNKAVVDEPLESAGERRKRSTAPSPSPQPFNDLPPELDRMTQNGKTDSTAITAPNVPVPAAQPERCSAIYGTVEDPDSVTVPHAEPPPAAAVPIADDAEDLRSDAVDINKDLPEDNQSSSALASIASTTAAVGAGVVTGVFGAVATTAVGAVSNPQKATSDDETTGDDVEQPTTPSISQDVVTSRSFEPSEPTDTLPRASIETTRPQTTEQDSSSPAVQMVHEESIDKQSLMSTAPAEVIASPQPEEQTVDDGSGAEQQEPEMKDEPGHKRQASMPGGLEDILSPESTVDPAETIQAKDLGTPQADSSDIKPSEAIQVTPVVDEQRDNVNPISEPQVAVPEPNRSKLLDDIVAKVNSTPSSGLSPVEPKQASNDKKDTGRPESAYMDELALAIERRKQKKKDLSIATSSYTRSRQSSNEQESATAPTFPKLSDARLRRTSSERSSASPTESIGRSLTEKLKDVSRPKAGRKTSSVSELVRQFEVKPSEERNYSRSAKSSRSPTPVEAQVTGTTTGFVSKEEQDAIPNPTVAEADKLESLVEPPKNTTIPEEDPLALSLNSPPRSPVKPGIIAQTVSQAPLLIPITVVPTDDVASSNIPQPSEESTEAVEQPAAPTESQRVVEDDDVTAPSDVGEPTSPERAEELAEPSSPPMQAAGNSEQQDQPTDQAEGSKDVIEAQSPEITTSEPNPAMGESEIASAPAGLPVPVSLSSQPEPSAASDVIEPGIHQPAAPGEAELLDNAAMPVEEHETDVTAPQLVHNAEGVAPMTDDPSLAKRNTDEDGASHRLEESRHSVIHPEEDQTLSQAVVELDPLIAKSTATTPSNDMVAEEPTEMPKEEAGTSLSPSTSPSSMKLVDTTESAIPASGSMTIANIEPEIEHHETVHDLLRHPDDAGDLLSPQPIHEVAPLLEEAQPIIPHEAANTETVSHIEVTSAIEEAPGTAKDDIGLDPDVGDSTLVEGEQLDSDREGTSGDRTFGEDDIRHSLHDLDSMEAAPPANILPEGAEVHQIEHLEPQASPKSLMAEEAPHTSMVDELLISLESSSGTENPIEPPHTDQSFPAHADHPVESGTIAQDELEHLNSTAAQPHIDDQEDHSISHE